MIIIPVALDQNEVRRMPWVTWVLMALCFAVQTGQSLFFAGDEARAERLLAGAVQYIAERPYLSVPPTLAVFLDQEDQAELERRHGVSGAPDLDDLAAEQAELNERTETAIGALRALPSYRLGFVPAQPTGLGMLTHMFVHAGWMHLLGNMLFLFLTGPFIEDVYGRPLFAALYLLSGLAAALAQTGASAGSGIPLVGASGAIAGVMGAFLWRLGTRWIRFLVLPIPIVPVFRFFVKLPAFVVLPLWLAEQMLYAKLTGATSGVAYAAHVGGFFAGLLLAIVVHALAIETSYVAPSIERQLSVQQAPELLRAVARREQGDLAGARSEIDSMLRRDTSNLDGWLESWEIALEARDVPAVERSGMRLIDLLSRAGEEDLLWTTLNDPRWRAFELPPRFLSAVADRYARAGDGRTALELHDRICSQLPPEDPAVLAALVGRGEILARAGDVQRARAAFDRARAHRAWSDLWSERVARALNPPTRAAAPARRG